MKFTPSILLLAVLILCSYPMFYYATKHYHPMFGGNDWTSYEKMMKNPGQFTAAPGPLVFRQFQSVIAAGIYSTKIHYATERHSGQTINSDKHLFAAMLSNYLALVLTAWFVGLIIIYISQRFLPSQDHLVLYIMACMGGFLCLLSFFALNSVITGLTEGWSWFLCLVGWFAISRRWLWVFFLTVLLGFFQRETLPYFWLIFAGIQWAFYENAKDSKQKLILMVLLSIASMIGYAMMVRNFRQSGLEWGATPLSMSPWKNQQGGVTGVLLQGFFSQNITLLYVVVWYYTRQTQAAIKKDFTCNSLTSLTRGLFFSLFIFKMLVVMIGLAMGVGANVGRLLSLTHPVEIVAIVLYLFLLWKSKTTPNF